MMIAAVVVALCAAVMAEESMPATPLQKTIDEIFKAPMAVKSDSLLDLERTSKSAHNNAAFSRASKAAIAEADAEKLYKMLEESDLPRSRRNEAESIVMGIEKDLKRMATASPHMKSNLIKATKLRTEAVKELLREQHNSAPAFDADEEDEEIDPGFAAADDDEFDAPAEFNDDAAEDDDLVSSVNSRRHSFAAKPAARKFDNSRVTRVSSDIAGLKAKVHAAHLPRSRELEVMDNLKHIESDAKQVAGLDHCVGSECHRRDNIRKALSLRMKALHKELEEQDRTPTARFSRSFEEDDDAEDDAPAAKEEDSMAAKFANKIMDDVAKFKQAIADAVMPAKEKKEVKENLDAIARDAEEYSEVDSATRKSHLKQAISLRMKALHKELEEQPATPKPAVRKADNKKIKAVEADLSALEEQVASVKLSPKLKKEVEDNLHAINKDAHLVAALPAGNAKRDHLKKAINLRVQALHKELEQSDKTAPAAAKVAKKAAPAAKKAAPAAKKVANKQNSADKVLSDVEKIRHELQSNKKAVSAGLRKEMEENLSAITKDVKKMNTVSSASKKEALTTAIKYRMNALKSELKLTKAKH